MDAEARAGGAEGGVEPPAEPQSIITGRAWHEFLGGLLARVEDTRQRRAAIGYPRTANCAPDEATRHSP